MSKRRLTFKRYFEKYKSGTANIDVFLCSLRNYLMVFQNEISIPDGMIPPENEYGIGWTLKKYGQYILVKDMI